MANPPASVESGHIVLEREIKLTATPSFRLPALGDLVEGVEAVPVPPQRLSATYFDTDDLRLARWGASLRRRSGEGWTVKLPVAADDLVRAYIRTAPLRPQARLRIVRWRTEARAAARLQDVLGEHQDAVVAERWLRVWVQRSRSAPAAFAARARWPEAWQALSTRLGGWS